MELYATGKYGLEKLSYTLNEEGCAHCEQLANEQKRHSLISPLNDYTTQTGHRRYRHRRRLKCGCQRRSILADHLEADFARLIGLLQVKPDAIDMMTEIALKAEGIQPKSQADFERQKQETLALCHRRIDAAVILFGDGHIDRAEYRKRIEENEREIHYWQNRTTETRKIAVELTACVEMRGRIEMLWKNGTDEDKQRIIRNTSSMIWMPCRLSIFG